jgi:LysR family transcriptional regulator, transcriptional activator of nhaA
MYSESMEWLNYHHLYYFWIVAKHGSIARAVDELRLAQPTISGQLKLLEDTLGEKLFMRAGRGLALTEVGQLTYRYADEIFTLGREFQDVLKGRPAGRPVPFRVGVSDLVPKLIAYRILQPALELGDPIQLICREDAPEVLLAELSNHQLDLVLADSPVPSTIRVKAYSHLLGSCGVVLFAAARLAQKYRTNFPHSLDGAPFLLPMEGSALRRALDQWFDLHNLRPRIVGEFQDSALLKTFGEAEAGIFPAPAAIQKEVRKHYTAAVVGPVENVSERYYALSVERKIKHPAVLAISEAAREQLFAKD